VTGADVLVLAASGGAALLALTAILRRAEGDPLALLWPDPGAEAGEAPLLRHGDHLLRPTPAAARLIGARPGGEAAEAAERLGRFFGREGERALDALRSAERLGEPARRLVRCDDGTPYELHVYPVGGLLCLDLHDASFIAGALAEERAARAPAAGAGPPAQAAGAGDRRWIEGLRALFESGSVIMWMRGPDGAESWSGGCVRFPGGTVTAADVLELLAVRREAQGAGPPRAGTRRLEVVRGASTLPLAVTEIPAPGGVQVGYAVDDSSASASERTLTRFVHTMTETFAHLTVGLAIFDRNQSLALFNPALVSMWQQDPAWLARRPGLREILDRLRSARRIPEMRDYHAWRDRLLGLFDDTEGADYEDLWTLSDGSIIRVLARPHPHGSLALIFDDATERMRLERRTRHMDDLINSTLEHLHEGLAVFAGDGTLQYVNRAFHEIWDTDSASVTLGMHASDLGQLCSRLTVETEVWERMVAFATGAGNRRAWTAQLSLGSGRMLGARFAPLPDGSTMAVFADVTDSERIAAALTERNEALEAAEQMRSAVLDQVSHRLRTPLNTIFGFGELLAESRAGPLNGSQETYVSGILEAAAQLLDAVGAVTELASLQLDPLEGEDDGPCVEEVLGTTAGLLEKRAAEAGVRLSVEFDGPVGVLGGTPVRLRQIVFNLAADAIHRCPQGGEITLAARREEDGTVEIATRETAGLAAADPRDEFNRVESNSLTLSLVRRLVAAEGGALEIAAEEDGRLRVGCRFPEAMPVLSEVEAG
jgi:signal transduction histidine kinase